MKKLLILITTVFIITSCTELQQVVNQLPQGVLTGQGLGGLSNTEIGNGLKQALEFGVSEGVLNLGKKDGYFKNELVKILLPEELKGVDKTLRSIGLASLADQGLSLLNRAAEDAVTEAAPIFKSAITRMTLHDASSILLGGNNAATQYLQRTTTPQLITSFQPKIQNSLGKVGADKIWEQIITKYNLISGKNINPNLTVYVTEKAVEGVFKMVAKKETDIRGNFTARSTNLLKKVFALQDKKP